MAERPPWKRGDILAMEHSYGFNVWRGCHVFKSDYDPVWRDGGWNYGYRRASEVRLATLDDINRLIEITRADIKREQECLGKLLAIYYQITRQNAEVI